MDSVQSKTSTPMVKPVTVKKRAPRKKKGVKGAKAKESNISALNSALMGATIPNQSRSDIIPAKVSIRPLKDAYRNESQFLQQHKDELMHYLTVRGLVGEDTILGSETPDLLLFARVIFWHRYRKADRFLDSLQVPSADYLEFIGDAVLHTIIVHQTYTRQLPPAQIPQRESNKTFFHYANDLHLCDNINTKVMKSCADIFEALVGAVYFELFYNRNLRYNAITLIEEWLHTVDPAHY